MLPKSVKRRLPTRHDVQKNKYLQFLGSHLHSPNLWHFNRRSVARATAISSTITESLKFDIFALSSSAFAWSSLRFRRLYSACQ